MKSITLLLALLSYACSPIFSAKKTPIAKNGILDLSTWDFEKDGAVELKGEWHFLWEQLLPKDGWNSQPMVAKVPSRWTAYQKEGKRLETFGYGTYQIEVKLPKNLPQDQLGFRIHAYENNVIEVDVDGINILRTGTIEKQGIENKFSTFRRNFIIALKDHLSFGQRSFVIRIRASNFISDGPGLTNAPSLGLTNSMQMQFSLQQLLASIVIGLLLMVFLYEFVGFLLNRKNTSSLLLSLFSLGFIFVEFCNKTDFPRIFFPNFWHIIILLGYSLVSGAYPLFINSIISPKIKNRWLLIFSSVFGILGPLITLTFGIYISHFNRFYLPMIGLGNLISYLLIFIFCAVNWYNNKNYFSSFLLIISSLSIWGLINDVLSALKIIHTKLVLGDLFLLIVIFQAFLLALNNARAHRGFKTLAKKLKVVNKDLEDTVAMRTKELQEKNQSMSKILANIQQGIFLINEDLKIEPQYSAYLKNIINEENIVGKDVMSTFVQKCELLADDVTLIRSTLLCVGEASFVFKLNSEHLPNEMLFSSKEGNKLLEVDWEPIVLKDSIDKIMISVRDVTEIRKLRDQAANQERESKKLVEIIESGLGNFTNNINSLESYLFGSREIISSLGVVNNSQDAQISEMLRNLHTIKGNSRSLSLKAIANKAHEVEQVCDSLLKSSESKRKQIHRTLLGGLNELGEIMLSYKNIFKNKLGGDDDIQHEITEYNNKNSLLKTIAKQGLTEEIKCKTALVEIDKILQELDYQSLKFTLKHNMVATQQEAKKLGKNTPQFDWGAKPILIPKNKSFVLRDVFGHLLRNSIDHGIETQEIRIARGKKGNGKLSFGVEYLEEGFKLHFGDDGAGLNLKLLGNKHEKGTNASDEELAELVFAPGVSTTNKLSEISGRGIGMDAVRSFLRKEGGDIWIEFVGDRDADGCRQFQFVMRLPYKIPSFILEKFSKR